MQSKKFPIMSSIYRISFTENRSKDLAGFRLSRPRALATRTVSKHHVGVAKVVVCLRRHFLTKQAAARKVRCKVHKPETTLFQDDCLALDAKPNCQASTNCQASNVKKEKKQKKKRKKNRRHNVHGLLVTFYDLKVCWKECAYTLFPEMILDQRKHSSLPRHERGVVLVRR